jgi:hypothetical protein
MIRFPKKKTEISAEITIKTIWISTFLAMILTLPPLGLFLGFYFIMENLWAGVIMGFGLHFLTLIFSGKISKFLTDIMS